RALLMVNRLLLRFGAGARDGHVRLTSADCWDIGSDVNSLQWAAEYLSRILKVHPHMAECRVESYRMWGEHVGSVMDCRERRAARGIARSGGFIRSRGRGAGAAHPAVAGRLDQRSDCFGILRAARQRAALALDIWSGRGSRAARPHGARPRSGEGAGCLVVIEEVLAPGVSERPNWTLPRLADEIEQRTGKRISKSRLSVVLKKGALPGVGRAHT